MAANECLSIQTNSLSEYLATSFVVHNSADFLRRRLRFNLDDDEHLVKSTHKAGLTYFELPFQSLLILLPILLLNCLVILNSVFKFGLDKSSLPPSFKHANPAKGQEEPYLLFANLSIASCSALAFQRLDAAF